MRFEKYILNREYMIEPSGDFDDTGRFKRGRGFYLNLVISEPNKPESLQSVGWFETQERAMDFAYKQWRARQDLLNPH